MSEEPTAPTGFAAHLKDALVGAHGHLADAIDGRKKAHLADVLETFEADLSPHLRAALGNLIDHPDISDAIKGLFAEASDPQHFTAALLVGIAVGSILGPAFGAATAPDIQAIENLRWHEAASNGGFNRVRHLTPDILASSVLKGVLDEDPAADVAAYSGTTGPDFHTMVETAGQSIGLAEALLLLRRNQITPEHFKAIVQYSNINPAFYDDPIKLLYAPLSAGEVITAALKGHLDDGPARDALGYSGIDPAHYDVLKASAGRPPGIQQMLELQNHSRAGLIATPVTQDDVDAAVRQSDINDAYLPFIRELGHYFPPPRSIVPMLRSGSINESQARKLLDGYGVNQEWQDAFIKEAQHQTVGAAKELTRAQVVQVYEARLIDRPTALARLEAIGLPAGDADLLLELADEKRLLAITNATVNKVGSLYVSHKITKAEAANALGTAGIPTAAQHDYFTLWDIQYGTVGPQPSASALVGAYRRGIIDAPTTRDRLRGLGIDDTDIPIYVVDGYPPTAGQEAIDNAFAVLAGVNLPGVTAGAPHVKVKELTATQVGKLYTQGSLTLATAIQKLIELGYADADARALLTLVTPPAPPTP